MKIGHIKFLDPKKCHGLITTGGADHFFRFQDGLPPFCRGDAVSFDLREEGRVKQAVNVIKVPASLLPEKIRNREDT